MPLVLDAKPIPHKPQFCPICKGTSTGPCGYRPHTLTVDCWCLNPNRFEKCALTVRWGLTPESAEVQERYGL